MSIDVDKIKLIPAKAKKETWLKEKAGD